MENQKLYYICLRRNLIILRIIMMVDFFHLHGIKVRILHLTLIPLILGGLGAAGGIAGGIATAVSGAKTNSNEASRNEEEKRHNIIMEEEAKRISGAGMGKTKEMIHSKNTVGVTSCPSCGSG